MFLSHPKGYANYFQNRSDARQSWLAAPLRHPGHTIQTHSLPSNFNLPASFMSTAFYFVGKHWRRSPGGRGQLSPHSALRRGCARCLYCAKSSKSSLRTSSGQRILFSPAAWATVGNPLQPGGLGEKTCLGDCGPRSSGPSRT